MPHRIDTEIATLNPKFCYRCGRRVYPTQDAAGKQILVAPDGTTTCPKTPQ